jgi:hypothetical protein
MTFSVGPLNVTQIQPPAAGGGGGGPLVFTITDSDFVAGTPAPPVTFTAVAIGAASADRIVCVSLAWLGTSSPSMDITTVTIGGVTATQAVYLRSSARANAVYYAVVPTGTTANIVVSGYTNGFVESIVANVGIMTGSVGASVASTNTASGYPTGGAQAITVPTNGMCVIAGYADSNGTPNTSIAYTNATGQSITNGVPFQLTGSIGHRGSSATITQNVTNISGADGWISAQFQP